MSSRSAAPTKGKATGSTSKKRKAPADGVAPQTAKKRKTAAPKKAPATRKKKEKEKAAAEDAA